MHLPFSKGFFCRSRTGSLLALLLFTALPASAQSLQGRRLSVTAQLGGPAGAYSLGLEHLFARTPTLQLGVDVDASYAHDVIWDGRARTLSARVFAARRIGAVGEQPLALEGGIGASVVSATFDETSSLSYRRQWLPHLSGALRLESLSGRLSYRLGAVLFSDDGEPFVLPLFGIGVGL